MKKHILLTSALLALTAANASALSYTTPNQGFENGEDLGKTLGAAVDDVFRGAQDAIVYIFELPEDTKKWTVGQVAELKGKICEKPKTIIKEVIKEVPVDRIVEKVVYVDRVVEVPAIPKERNCTTKRQSDRFGNVDEVVNCTEWK